MIEGARKKSGNQGVGVAPYVPFSTFRNFLDRISVRVPSRIDHSVMPRTSRVMRFQLAAALRYMGLVSRDGSATETLVRLAKARGEERRQALAEVIRAAYPYLFGDFDLANCTTAQMSQEFRRSGASGDTIRKCVAFFIAACREAGVDVSPHIKPFWRAEAGGQRSANSSEIADSLIENPNFGSPQQEDALTVKAPSDWRASLLLKFPNLDPTWSDEIKSKWFDDFSKLIEYIADKSKRP